MNAGGALIVLLFRLHLKSISSNGRLFNIPSSPRTQLSITLTQRASWELGRRGLSLQKSSTVRSISRARTRTRTRTRTSTRTKTRRTRTEPEQNQTSRQQEDMQCVRCPAILVLVALVLGVSSQPDRDQDEYQNQDLELELRHHRLLQRARNAGLLSQEWSKRAVEDLLAQMSLPEADAQREAEVVSMETGGKMNLERSVDPPNNLPPRERKAGCKNFYWKGFTSC
ncbi:somatostatin-2-like [Thunnus albacares]|uniref:somatostatin-2-like n=2 Tax=Thunnus TaxID=8234 RepID=UPI001CF6B62B|nr:somatostatin-2-like [Thunnus albacares]